MTWKITVEYVDDKTGEYFTNHMKLTGDIVKNSNLDELDMAFQKILDALNLKIEETKK